MDISVATFSMRPTDSLGVAPISAINRIIEKHEQLRQLVNDGRLRRLAFYDDRKVVARYSVSIQWESANTDLTKPVAAEA